MKVGIRKPSLKKSVKARTTGRVKRAVKSSIDPTYGKKGAGWVKDPKKAAYNKVYNKTTVGVNPVSNSESNSNGAGCIFYLGLFIFIFYVLVKVLF